MRRRFDALFLGSLLATLPLGGCEDEFSGPGSYVASVAVPEGAAAVGAAVLQIEGRGIQSFGDRGTTRSFGGETEEPEGPRRLVVVGLGERLTFQIRVDDMSMSPPRGVVISAVDTDNRLLSVVGFVVGVERAP